MPPFPSRVALAKLFIETSQPFSALQILTALEQEDDSDIQVQYDLGIAWYLLAEARFHGRSFPTPADESTDLEDGPSLPGLKETAEECGIEARDALQMCLKVVG